MSLGTRVVTALVALLATTALLVATAAVARELAGCYVQWIPTTADPVCGPRQWGFVWIPGVLLVLGTGVLVPAVASGVRTAWRQFVGARRLHARLGAGGSLDTLPGTPPGVRATLVELAQPVAITVGLLRPRVVVSTGLVELLEGDELAAVLAHEAHHARAHHPLVYGLARTLAAVGWSAPVLRHWADRVVLHAEVRADRAAAEGVGRGPLARALLKLVEVPQPDPADAAVGSVRGMLTHRVAALAGERVELPVPPAARRRTAATLGLLLLVVGAAAIAFYRNTL